MLELVRHPEIEQRLKDQGYEITPRSELEFAQWIGQETAKWRQLGKEANIKPEV
jgi:tripartite-type tricarboxylate transporter receptor subunit TctC